MSHRPRLVLQDEPRPRLAAVTSSATAFPCARSSGEVVRRAGPAPVDGETCKAHKGKYLHYFDLEWQTASPWGCPGSTGARSLIPRWHGPAAYRAIGSLSLRLPRESVQISRGANVAGVSPLPLERLCPRVPSRNGSNGIARRGNETCQCVAAEVNRTAGDHDG